MSACWQHATGVTGVGSWNFGGFTRKDHVVIYGSKGEISFSVFDEQPIVRQNETSSTEFVIEHPENIQLFHVENISKQLFDNIKHPSNGKTALHTSWVMDKILASE